MKRTLLAISCHNDFLQKNKDLFDFFEKENYEVHFWEIDEREHFYPEFPVETLLGLGYDQGEEAKIVFVSDNRQIITFTYRMFRSCFSVCIWIPEEEEELLLNGLCKQISDFNAVEKESFNDKIIVYFQNELIKNALNFIFSNKNYLYFEVAKNIEDIPIKVKEIDLNLVKEKEYYWEENYYSLGEATTRKQIVLEEGYSLSKSQLNHTILAYLLRKPIVLEWALTHRMWETLENEILVDASLYTESGFERDELVEIIRFYESYFGEDAIGTIIYIFSYLLHQYKKEEDIEAFLDFLVKQPLDLFQMRFIHNQLLSFLFTIPYSLSMENQVKWYRLYERTVKFARCLFQEELSIFKKYYVGKKDNILILCGQFLVEGHAPTRRAMDYASTYAQTLHANTMVINTADLVRNPEMSYYKRIEGHYMENYDSEKFHLMKIEGMDFPFYQIRYEYKNEQEIKYLLNEIQKFAPTYVFVVGGYNLLGDLIAPYIPTATIECGYTMPVTCGGYRIMSREIEEKDRKFAKAVGIDENTMIESFITFKKPKSENKKLEKNKEEFVICIVSNRINRELSEEMIELCDRMLEIDSMIKIKIFGIGFDSEKLSLLSRYPHRYFYEGFQEDILSAYTGCDAYYNLKRYGGGSSVGQAMLMGLPIVSHRFGDGSYVLGRNRCFDSSEDLILEVERLVHDKEYYDESKRYSLKRAEEIFDTERMIRNVDKNIREKIATDFRYARTE